MNKCRMVLLGLLVVTAMVTVPAVTAQAGTSTVASYQAPAASSAPSQSAIPQNATRTIHPRVKCGAFDGTISWDHQDISGSGILKEFCGGRTYMHVSWNDPFHNDRSIGTWVYRGNTGVSWSFGTTLSPSNIAVYVCNTYGGWHCGTPVHV